MMSWQVSGGRRHVMPHPVDCDILVLNENHFSFISTSVLQVIILFKL
jgi:hypothetical protein